MSKHRLIIFDVDGTLVKAWNTELLPGVNDWFRMWRVLQKKPYVAFATNQGGPVLRNWMMADGWGDPWTLPNMGTMVLRLMQVRQSLINKYEIPIFVSTAYQTKGEEWAPYPYDQEKIIDVFFDIYCDPATTWRKPNPAMLQAAMRFFKVPEAHTLMVGDSEDDQKAAHDSRVDFQWADDFFERRDSYKTITGLT